MSVSFTRNAFTGEDVELVVNYTAKKSFSRRAIELTCKLTSISLCRQKLKMGKSKEGTTDSLTDFSQKPEASKDRCYYPARCIQQAAARESDVTLCLLASQLAGNMGEGDEVTASKCLAKW